MNHPLKQIETRVNRTYMGGMMIDKFLGKQNCCDCNMPEDWISSFVEAKNKEYIPNEGITRVETDHGIKLITDVITKQDFGMGRTVPGVLIKYLDSMERLGIQVHPTKQFAKKHFNSEFGKTECWHILDTREIDGEQPVVYIGFKEHVTKELFRKLFINQDVDGMLDSMHKFEVKKGDTVLIRGGTPHAIGAGCFILEIQEPSDYTMRAETTTKGKPLTDKQIHYGVGIQNMLDCFDYTPKSREQTQNECFLKPTTNGQVTEYVNYLHTDCFKLEQITSDEYTFQKDDFATFIIKKDGVMTSGGITYPVKKGEKYFISALCDDITIKDCDILVCYGPKINL